jgi:hypothetical protein
MPALIDDNLEDLYITQAAVLTSCLVLDLLHLPWDPLAAASTPHPSKQTRAACALLFLVAPALSSLLD